MDVYTTEEQQVEAIRKWWRDNKWSIIGGVLLGVALIVGGRTWLDNRKSFAETGATLYQSMMQQIAESKFQEASQNGNLLLAEFANTPYAALGALGMARIKLEEGDATAAISHLRWVLDNSDQAPLVHEARLRTGKLLLDQGKAAEALALLEGVKSDGFESGYEQLKGDIQVALNNPVAAAEAYQKALTTLTAGSTAQRIVQMKLDDLGVGAQDVMANSGKDS